jgi:hypothetical protein
MTRQATMTSNCGTVFLSPSAVARRIAEKRLVPFGVAALRDQVQGRGEQHSFLFTKQALPFVNFLHENRPIQDVSKAVAIIRRAIENVLALSRYDEHFVHRSKRIGPTCQVVYLVHVRLVSRINSIILTPGHRI